MLSSLHIRNFKCFEDLRIGSLARVNLITGKNNTGKTSLLEAVYTASGKNNWYPVLSTRGEDINNNLVERFDAFASLFFNRNILEEAFINEHALQLINNKTGKPYTLSESNNYFEHLDCELRLLSDLDSGPCKLVGSAALQMRELETLWDDAFFLTPYEDTALQVLQQIEPDIEKIGLGKTPGGKRRFQVLLKGQKRPIPLMHLGEGMGRILGILLSIVGGENGILLIDEFENGLHYSVQRQVWEAVFRLAQALDVQVFATTHSRDCVEAFAAAANQPGFGQDARLIRLYRNPQRQIREANFDAETVQTAIENQIELR
ncbi:MAG: AAA family ATPase [Bacteroidia bacterium]|nr:AAA family ATPase [Bacteroidia bacterium]